MARFWTGKTFRILVALVLSLGLFLFCFHQVEWNRLWEAWRQANIFYLLAAFLPSLCILCLNSLQLKFFLPRFNQVSFFRMFQVVSVFSMTVNVIPFWGGHAFLVYWLGQKEKIGSAAALSVMTLDQIVEGPAKLLVFAYLALSSPLPPWIREGMRGFVLLVLIAYLILMAFAFRFRNQPHAEILEKKDRWGRVRAFIANWAHHLHVLRSFQSLWVTVLLATVMKALEVCAVFFLQKSFGLDLGWNAAVLVTAALSLATTLPLTPGRLGQFEAAAMLSYQFLGVPASQALALAMTIHATHTLPFVLAGYLSGFKLGLKSEKKSLTTALA